MTRFLSHQPSLTGLLALSLMVSVSVMTAQAIVLPETLPVAEASLSDLIKRPAQLFVPSQLLPGESAEFTVRAKAGASVELIVSSVNSGKSLPNGTPLRVGEPIARATGVIPATGVLKLTVTIPKALDMDYQFVEAVLWRQPDQSDAEVAQLVGAVNREGHENLIAVGARTDKGSTMIMPMGDPQMANIMRSMQVIDETAGDERKRKLIDDGKIDRRRDIDKNLTRPITPNSGGLLGY